MGQNKTGRKRSAGLLIPLGGLLLILCYVAGIRYTTANLKGNDGGNGETSKHYVALVVKSTTSAFWKSVFSGANAAGTEYNLTLTIEGPDNEEDYKTRMSRLQEPWKTGRRSLFFPRWTTRPMGRPLTRQPARE